MQAETSYSYFRHRLRWGQTYPIKKGVVDNFLLECGVSSVSRVSMWSGDTPSLARVDWNGWDRHPPETASLMLYSVAAAEATRCRELMLQHVLPAIRKWLREFEDAPETRRSENHDLTFVLDGGELIHTES